MNDLFYFDTEQNNFEHHFNFLNLKWISVFIDESEKLNWRIY
jgi:hypothetical protein